MKNKKCEIYDRDCIGCMECEICELDPNKICDNCGKCIEMDDCASIKIDVIFNSDGSVMRGKKQDK